ncbi:MAG: TrkA C-terminal domain-containing protein [Planctomycetota bacterium]|nr:TrkA C-terminal domain-containing protein [Planctomycetota bacterium]
MYVAALLLIVLLSIFVVRAGAVALAMTGLSPDVARFQALSAFTGTGFTTSEAESLVGHPARRNIISLLMLLGNAGLFSALAAVILSFSQAQDDEVLTSILGIIVGLLVLLGLSNVRLLNVLLNRVLQRLFGRFSTLRIRDYEELLRVDRGYSISHVMVDRGGWLEDRSLRELAMVSEGILVLSIRRSTGTTLDTPGPMTRLFAGDQLLVYGRERDLEALPTRPAGAPGDRIHATAVEQQRLRRAEESAEGA